MLTLLDVVKRTTEFFTRHGVESPRLNAELILAHALGLQRMQIYLQFERPLTDVELEKIRPLVRRRSQREPLAYILGTAAFGDLTLKVDSRVLIPRPETEQLVELIRGRVTTPPAAILDLGTGSGALALALAQAYPESHVTAVDASTDALALAAENGAAAGLAQRVTWCASNWFDALDAQARFNLVVSNPPYLTAEELATAAPEVRDHEPRRALVSDDDGCADALRIIAGAPQHLEPGGWLFLETGPEQHPRLLAALGAAGLIDAASHPDLSGRNRFVSAHQA